MEGLGTLGKRPEPFGHEGKSIPPPIKVNSFADQGAIRPVANPKSACGQTDSACGQIVSTMWPLMSVGVNTLLN
jgi:hypothetical protein